MPKKMGANRKVNLEFGGPSRNFTRDQSRGPGGKTNFEGATGGRGIPQGGFTDQTTGKSAGGRKLRGSGGFKEGKGS